MAPLTNEAKIHLNQKRNARQIFCAILIERNGGQVFSFVKTPRHID